MASASAGLELPATSLMAPLLGRIAVSWREAPLPRALITRRRQGWQYDGQPGSGFVPVDSGSLGLRGVALTLPSMQPNSGLPEFGLLLTGRSRIDPTSAGGSRSSLLRATVRVRWR